MKRVKHLSILIFLATLNLRTLAFAFDYVTTGKDIHKYKDIRTSV